jgi:hypothetical protein
VLAFANAGQCRRHRLAFLSSIAGQHSGLALELGDDSVNCVVVVQQLGAIVLPTQAIR